ncbi:DUF6171 family protein [Paenibacillus crassostreae]|uniref:Uncharacterized protein n=1 Tax=Paenibacillus crassostreae TaxID=1763538 RepID=A0A167AJK2_9BACL|nr:DUF6171 family protein [Paenibacillus crassostreae]AOZ92389.1 hypothetical protein LPB68_09195 [Paenibacillus crassostreae]OAB71104.1 hypothetical protein PNBC_21345 [Paenibacillus crassostreae]
MIEQETTCKGCREEYKVTDQQITRVLATMKITPEQSASDAVYAERLQICSGCTKLMNNHTCTLCGCIVPITAKFKDKKCPFPGEDRWASNQ